MAMVEVSIVPVGTGGPSASEYVARALKVLEAEPDLTYELTAMGTIIQGELDRLLNVVSRMHETAFDSRVKRVVTTIKIDDRRDKPLTIGGKIDSDIPSEHVTISSVSRQPGIGPSTPQVTPNPRRAAPRHQGLVPMVRRNRRSLSPVPPSGAPSWAGSSSGGAATSIGSGPPSRTSQSPWCIRR